VVELEDGLDEEDIEKDPRAQLRKLKDQGDNSLVIALKLMTGENLSRMKVLLEVTRPTWTAHSARASEKLTAEESYRDLSIMILTSQ
jgi:hypothetical protein